MENRHLVRRSLPFCLMIFVVIFSSCGSIEPLSISKVESVNIENYSSGELSLKLSVKVKNPNNLKFKIKDNHLDLVLNGKEIGTAKVKETIIIQKHSDDSHVFFVDATLSKMAFAGIPGLLGIISGKPVELKIKGNVKIKTLGLSKKYPIEIIEKIDLKQLGKNFLN